MPKSFIYYKRIRSDRFGDSIIALPDKVFSDIEVDVIASSTVTDEENMRPDKISYKWFGTTKWWWFILKFNGISNPFALESGMQYRIPDVNKVLSKMGVLSTSDEIEIPETQIKALKAKKPSIDPRKIEYNNKRKTTTDVAISSTGVALDGNNNLVFSDNQTTGINSDIDITNSTNDIETIEETPQECSSVCDNENSDFCKLCQCNPKLSDVLNFKILNS